MSINTSTEDKMTETAPTAQGNSMTKQNELRTVRWKANHGMSGTGQKKAAQE